MAAFFHQGPAGIFGELVPLVDLVQERQAVFQDADRLDLADRLALQRFVDRFDVDRLVTVLQADLEHGRMRFGNLGDLIGVGMVVAIGFSSRCACPI